MKIDVVAAEVNSVPVEIVQRNKFDHEIENGILDLGEFALKLQVGDLKFNENGTALVTLKLAPVPGPD